MVIKKVILVKNEQPIFPVTSGESVLIKKDQKQQTLSEVLDTKIDSSSEELTIVGTRISHTNIISPSSKKQSYIISYNSTGHIVDAEPAKSLKVIVQDKELEYNGSESKNMQFSDSFKIENDKIELNWKEHGNS